MLHIHTRHEAGEAEVGLFSIATAARISNPSEGPEILESAENILQRICYWTDPTSFLSEAIDSLVNEGVIEETEREEFRISQHAARYPNVR
jgi:hypothetical protein